MSDERFVKIGDLVRIHFTGKLENGEIFESSFNKNPLEFKVGNGDVIIGIDEAVIGMKVGQRKQLHLSSDKAYGPREKELIISIEKNKLPASLDLKEGYELKIPNEDGEPFIVRITNISDEFVELDGNHPLAGKNLIFEITLVEIV